MSSEHAFDPPAARPTIRVTNVYGTTWAPVEHVDGASPLDGHLRLGRLAGFYRDGADQLPAVACSRTLETEGLGFVRWTGTSVAATLWLFTLPSGQTVVGLTVELSGRPDEAIDLLEDCYYGDVTIDGTPLERHAAGLAVSLGVPQPLGFAPERHQLVFLPSLGEEDGRFDVVQKLVYRADLPYRPEFSSIAYPAELNRRPYATVAVGPYVSVLSGQQDYIENAAFVSAVQCVASSVRLRETRDLAYEDVRLFRDAQAGSASVHVRRHTLERMANQLGNLELELSFSIESAHDLGLLIPSLRVVSYHETLFENVGLRGKAEVVGRMLQRLERSIAAEMTAIESVERRADEDRRLRWTAAVGFISTVALPISLVLTFFGINAAEVDQQQSMFSPEYLPMYGIVVVLVALGLGLSLGLLLQQRLRARRDAARSARAMSAVRQMVLVRRRTFPALR